MGELLSGVEGQFRGQGMGTPGTKVPTEGTVPAGPLSVSDALDGDLDAYLDRELFVRPRAEAGSEVSEAAPRSSASGSMRALLDLAEEESEWLETLPPPASATAEPPPEPEEPAVEIPEWMRVAPGAKETTRFAAMLTPTEAPLGDAGTDAAGLPTTPWSVPATSGPLPGSGFASAPAHPHGGLLPGVVPPPPGMAVPGVPLAPWAPRYAQQWGTPMVAPPEPKRVLGMRPGAFLGAAAVGALAAGLLVVAGLHFREHASGVNGAVVVSAPSVAQGAPASGPVPGDVTGTATTPVAQPAMAAQAGTTPGLPGAQPGAIDTLPSGMSGAAQASTAPGALPPGTLPGPQDGVAGTATAASTSAPSGARDAAASVAGTVLSTAQADVRGAANGLRASEPTPVPVNGSAVGGTTLTSGRPTARKGSAKAPAAVPSRPATDTNEEADTGAASGASELAFDEAGADEESAGSSEEGDTESGETVAVSAADARPPNQYSELDEDFARELGFTEDAEKKEAVDPNASRTVYIPPAPDAKEHLTPDDVKAVVVTNQPAITACIRQHAKGTPVEGGGRFLVRWSVLPSGDTSSVAMDTDTLRATPLAHCIEDVVRRWKFPAHQVRMQEPIRFPFVF